MKNYINFLCVLILALTLIDLVYSFIFPSSNLVLNFDLDSYSMGALLALLGVALVALCTICMAFVSFIKFILNVNRNEVFTEKNVSLIRKYGVCSLLCAVCTIILCTFGGLGIGKAVMGNIDLLGEGFFALLMGEVFGIGLKLKEGKSTAA